MRTRLVTAALTVALAVALAPSAGADLATGTVTDPDDVDIALDLASASLSDIDGTVTLTATTHDPFTDEQIAFYWLLQGRSDDSADAGVFVQFNPETQEVEAFLMADPGGTVTVSRPSDTSIEAVFARSALGDLGPLSYIAGAGEDVDGDGRVDESEADQAPDTFEAAVFRIAGDDRIETALAAWSSIESTAVVLARSDGYADALAGVPLAAANDAPILLTAPDALDPRVRDTIGARLVPGGRVFLLGGTTALSATIEDDLRSDGYDVVRLFGEDRYDTSVVIARDGLESPSTVILTRGDDFPDALPAGPAAAAAGGAVLLTAGTTMPEPVRAYLETNPPAQRFAVGGAAAAADPSATAIAGEDRYETAVRVAERFFTDLKGVAVVSGERFPDALAGGAIAGGEDPTAPLLLTHPTSLTPVVRTYLEARSEQFQIAVIFGGPIAMAETLVDQIEAAIR